MRIEIRKENINDYQGIKNVNDLAFGQTNEGLLVEKLRNNSGFMDQLSLVAEIEGKVIGHFVFSNLDQRRSK